MFKKVFKNKTQSKNKHKIRQRLLLVVIFTLLIISITRAYSLNRYYIESSQEETKLLTSINENKTNLLTNILNQVNDISKMENVASSKDLQIRLMEQYTIDEIHDSIINKKYNPDMSKLIDEIFENSIYYNKRGDNIVILCTDDDIFWLKSNIHYDKFNYLDTNGNKSIDFNDFFNSMDNPIVTKKAFDDLKMKRNEGLIILRPDGKYLNDTYYTIDDMVDVYNKYGLQGLKGYSVLNLATITETGDMFGNSDKEYMELNKDSKKIYVYQTVDLYSLVKDYEDELNSLETKSMDTISSINHSKNINMVINVFILILTIVAVIVIMIVYKDLQDDQCSQNKIE